MAAVEPHGMESSGLGSMKVRRLEAGILDNGTVMDMSMTPFEAGLEPLSMPAFETWTATRFAFNATGYKAAPY